MFADSTLPEIAASGNIGNYVDSVERWSAAKIVQLYLGHGRTSSSPKQDMKNAVGYAEH